ncbi:Fic family protein [Sporosarcina sp. 179-K 3D1 HS]|uniref:Fic/DOC family protein n=1 Tax=Sporosarcina sp. 179-K 3D1 HS TaxID=3232169 RepID=UPI0039A0B6A8
MKSYNHGDNDPYPLQHNLLGLQTYEELEEAEALVFSLRAAELEKEGYSFSFTKDGFKNLHKHLFQDIYPFAGEFRTVQLMKGSTRFCQVQFLEQYATELFGKLSEEPDWASLEEAAERLAFFKSELNMLHPFREGNGRTIRIFIHAYARSKGVEWQYETIERNAYMRAMVQSVTSTELLKALFLETIHFYK